MMPEEKEINLESQQKSFMSMITSQEEKTRITVMMELLKMSNLEFITEYPNFTYTKYMTKLETWRASVQEVFNLDDEQSDKIVKAMENAFMKKNVSHKRRRSHEMVNALRGEDANANVLDHENKGLRRFLGLR